MIGAEKGQRRLGRAVSQGLAGPLEDGPAAGLRPHALSSRGEGRQ